LAHGRRQRGPWIFKHGTDIVNRGLILLFFGLSDIFQSFFLLPPPPPPPPPPKFFFRRPWISFQILDSGFDFRVHICDGTFSPNMNIYLPPVDEQQTFSLFKPILSSDFVGSVIGAGSRGQLPPEFFLGLKLRFYGNRVITIA